MLQVTDAVVKYGEITALHGVTFEVKQGEIVTLLGANGAGKTTTLRTLSGLHRVSSGSIFFEGNNITSVPAHKFVSLGISHVPEGRRIFPVMTVEENLEMGAFGRNDHYGDDLDRIYTMFPILKDRRKQNGGNLSGGEQQMLAIGRALMSQPRLLLLDEPFGALDAQVRVELRSWLRDFHHRIPVTTIMVTHDQQEAMEVADQLIIMAEGAIQQTGDPRHIYASPSNEFVQGFLGPITNFGGVPVRPHDLEIRGANAPGEHAVVTAIQNFGFEVRVDLRTEHDTSCWVQLSTREAETLSLSVGDAVTVSVRHEPALMI